MNSPGYCDCRGSLPACGHGEQRELNLANGERSALQALCPLTRGAGINRYGNHPMQLRRSADRVLQGQFRLRVVQDAARPHPGADQHEEPGGSAARIQNVEARQKHKRVYCTMPATINAVSEVPPHRSCRLTQENGPVMPKG